MKKLILFIFISTFGWSTATVTGNVFTLSNGAPTSVKVVFTLQNCRTTPRVVGTGLIVSTIQSLDVDAAGNVSGQIWRNDELTCVSLNDSFYTISIIQLQGGQQQSVKTMNIKVNSATLDLNSAPTINNLTPAPFTPLNVITNPPAGQLVAQPIGTATTFSGDGFPLAQQSSTDVEHGIEIKDSTEGYKWRWAQQPTNVGEPSYSLMLKSITGGTTEKYFRCVIDGAAVGSGSCRWLAGLVDTDVATTFDFSTALQTNTIKAVASSPPTPCIAKTSMVIDQSGTGGQKLKICNSSGNGYDLVGDGGSAAGVTSFIARTGDIVAVAGDYATLTETLQNKTIDSVNNTVITRSKIWFDFAGNNISTANPACDTPTTGGATATSFVGTTNTQLSYGVLSFADAATSVVTCKYRLPSDYSGASASVDLTLLWYQDTSVGDPGQVVKWQSAVTCVGPGQSLDKAWNTATATTSATAAQYLNISLTFTALTSTSCDAGDMLIFKVERLGADGADTFTNTARGVGAELTLVRSQ